MTPPSPAPEAREILARCLTRWRGSSPYASADAMVAELTAAGLLASCSAEATQDRSPEREAVEVAWLWRLLKVWVSEVENEPERWPLDPHCNDCTQGQTPKDQDHGPCIYHETIAALSGAPAPAVPKAERVTANYADGLRCLAEHINRGDVDGSKEEAEWYLGAAATIEFLSAVFNAAQSVCRLYHDSDEASLVDLRAVVAGVPKAEGDSGAEIITDHERARREAAGWRMREDGSYFKPGS